MGRPPAVTGISPKEGPPGTKLTVRGEHLGTGQQDLVCVMIGSWDSTLTAEWHSPNKIVLLAGNSPGFCDVIISTRSGGVGSCTVKFKGVDQVVGHLKESAVWLKEFSTEREQILQELVSTHSLGQEDVLGISMEGYEVRFPDEELEALFPGRSGSLFSEQFHPAWFLLENHHQSGYDDLRAGLSFLRRKVNAEKEGQLTFLKDYAGLVIDQLDALSEMRELFQSHTAVSDPVAAMDQAINASKEEADKLFQEVLRRKERADRTRSALGVLQRYRFLFYLPVSIERNMRRREFDVIINDYAKARGLFADTEVQVFKQVMAVVETKIVNLRDILRAKLKDVNGSFEEQKQIIRYLVSLDTPGDVGWECIVSEQAFIGSVLASCREQYVSPGSSTVSSADAQTAAPPIVLFIEDVADRMAAKFPGLFKLGQCYFQGELHTTPDPARKPDFKRLVSSVVELWCSLVRGALLPHTADTAELAWPDTLRQPLWLEACLREVTATYGSLQGLGVAPESLDEVSQLVFDLRKHCLMALFRRTMDSIRQLSSRGACSMDTTLDASGYGYTKLLAHFMTAVTEVVHQAEEQILSSGPQETPLMQNETVRKDVVVLLYNVVATFAQVLERLAFDEAQSDDEGDESEPAGRAGGGTGAGGGGEPPAYEFRLLVVLSNCHVLRVSRVPQIAELFINHGFPEAEVRQGLQKVTDVLADLEQKLFEAYMEEKADPILGIIEMSMYQGKFDWSAVRRPPADVRGYVKEVLMNCIAVHAEVYSVSPLLVRRVMCNLVEGVAEELGRLLSSATRMTPAGGQQARLDLAALQQTLRLYVTDAARASFTDARETLPNHQDPAGDHRLVDQLLQQFRANMKLQIMCFSREPSLEDFQTDD